MHECYSATALSTLANLGSAESDREVLRNALSELIASGAWLVVRWLDDVHNGAPLLVDGERSGQHAWPIRRVDEVIRATPGSCSCGHRRVDVVARALARQPTVEDRNELVTRTRWMLRDDTFATSTNHHYGFLLRRTLISYDRTLTGKECVAEAIKAGRIRRAESSIGEFRPALEPLVKAAGDQSAIAIDRWLADTFGADYHEAFDLGYAGGSYAGWSDGGDYGGDDGGGGGE